MMYRLLLHNFFVQLQNINIVRYISQQTRNGMDNLRIHWKHQILQFFCNSIKKSVYTLPDFLIDFKNMIKQILLQGRIENRVIELFDINE